MRRIALLLEYNGARFAGSQYQPDAPTVQGDVEAAIEEITQEKTRLALAGRTDAGVHALGQVGAIDINSGLERAILFRAMNAVLPKDIAIRAIAEVEPGFDPRRRAIRRQYRYLIDNGPARPVLERGQVWYVGGGLDIEAMAAAAQLLVGIRDFAAFAGPVEAGASTVRDLQRLTVARDGQRVRIDAVANAFLPHQVRRMTGALVEVGRRRLGVEEFGRRLDGSPGSAGPAAPARGLALVSVEYEKPLFAPMESEAPV